MYFRYDVVTNIGLAVAHESPTIETYILDSSFVSRPLYGAELSLILHGKLRNMIKFENCL